MFDFLKDMFGQILLFFSQISGSLGMGIILLTIAIRLALYPLTLSQSRSLAAMRELQPKLQELQKKYKNKPEEYQRKMLELYQEHKVNPLGGCLPILVQAPFLLALFYVLRDLPNLVGEEETTFLIWNLSVSAAEAGMSFAYLILPLLSGLTTYFQMSLTSTSDPSQRMMMMIMPIFLTYISTQFPSGLVLYWVVTNVFSIAQQYAINRQLAAAKKGEGAG